MNREAYERQYKLGYQRGAMDSESQLSKVYDELLEMQVELRKHLNKHTETDWQAHLAMLESIKTRLVGLLGP